MNRLTKLVSYAARAIDRVRAEYLAFRVRGDYDYHVLYGSTPSKREEFARTLTVLLGADVYTEPQFPNSPRKKDVHL